MLFNLLETGYITASGTTPFNQQIISEILSVSGTLTISGSNNDNFWIYGDIVDRIAVSQIRYYFDSSTSSGTVASGISFYYKNDAVDNFSLLTTNIGPGYYYSTVPNPSTPRYIKLVHTVSGTAIDGTVVGLEVLNDDSVVDFGLTGSITSDTTLTSLSYLNYNDYIKEIPIYNSGVYAANAYIFIDPQYNDTDTLLSISASEDGPWVTPRNTDYIISNSDNWQAGVYSGTYTVGYNQSWDPNRIPDYIALYDNNLRVYKSNTINSTVVATQAISNDMNFNSKWYWEITINNVNGSSADNHQIGVAPSDMSNSTLISANANGYCYRIGGTKCNNGSCSAFGDSFAAGDIIGVALDMEVGEIYFSKNGVWQDGGVPASGTNPAFSGLDLDLEMLPAWGCYEYGNQATANFGASAFSYTVPEGYWSFAPLTSDGKLRLYHPRTEGTYITPIFKNEASKLAYVDVLRTSVSGSIIAVDSEDYTSTIQIRSSNEKPKDYNAYRILYYPVGSNQFKYIDYLVSNDVEVYDSRDATGTVFGTSWTYYSYVYTIYESKCIVAEDTQNSAFIIMTTHTQGSYSGAFWIEVVFLSPTGVQYAHNIISSAGFDTRGGNPYSASTFYDIKFDSNDGVWLYLYIKHTPTSYSASPSMGNELNHVGYWLAHFNSSLVLTYSVNSEAEDFVYGSWAPAIGSDSLWYCSQGGVVAVIKISATGTIEATYDEVTNAKGLCATPDGGCWFIDEDILYRLDSSGELIDSITNIDVWSELTFVEYDSEDTDFLWIVDGVYVRRIRLDGTNYSSVYLEGYSVYRLLPTSEGLWVYCIEGDTGDYYAKFIGKTSTGVEKSVQCVSNDGSGTPCDIGIKNVSYDDPILGDIIPLTTDPVWNDSLSWNKTVTANTILPREKYNQLKLTLRRENAGIDSPTVDNIYYQDSVEITDIQPGESKTLYLKISLPEGGIAGGDYASNLRVWWELPTS